MWPRHRSAEEAGAALGFKSGLEVTNSNHQEALGYPVLYETFKLRYLIPETFHIYTPDFRLHNNIIVETKGRWLATDRAKMLLVKASYPDLDIRMVFSSAKTPIATGSKTTVSDFATKHGFPWAVKLIPEAWLKESGPKYTIEEAIKRRVPSHA